MSEFLGNMRGSSDRKSEAELGQEAANVEISPSTPVRHVDGSKLYHPDMQCRTLAAEQERFKNGGIGYLFRHLPNRDELELCPDCDKKKIAPTPKDPYAPR